MEYISSPLRKRTTPITIEQLIEYLNENISTLRVLPNVTKRMECALEILCDMEETFQKSNQPEFLLSIPWTTLHNMVTYKNINHRSDIESSGLGKKHDVKMRVRLCEAWERLLYEVLRRGK